VHLQLEAFLAKQSYSQSFDLCCLDETMPLTGCSLQHLNRLPSELALVPCCRSLHRNSAVHLASRTHYPWLGCLVPIERMRSELPWPHPVSRPDYTCHLASVSSLGSGRAWLAECWLQIRRVLPMGCSLERLADQPRRTGPSKLDSAEQARLKLLEQPPVDHHKSLQRVRRHKLGCLEVRCSYLAVERMDSKLHIQQQDLGHLE